MAGPGTTTDVLEAAGQAWTPEYVDPLSFLWDDPNFGTPVSPVSLPGDREDGQERRLIETEMQLAAIRGQARVISWSTPFIANVLESLANYTIGGGFSYTAQADAKVRPESVPAGLVEAVQDVIDEFLDDNNWCGSREREGEILKRTVRDGESFVSLGVDDCDRIVSRLIDPEQVTEPGSPRHEEDWLYQRGLLTYAGPLSWSFGILTPDGDVERTLGYWVQWTQSSADSDFLPCSQVEHLKLNSDSNVKRGWSDLYCILQDALREAKLRKNTVVGAAIQAAIAWVQEMQAGTTKSDAERMVSGNATSSRVNVAGRTVQQQEYKAGSILRVPNGAKYVPPPMGSERIPNFMAIASYVLRAIGARWSMPEYMISGDASNANYASTMVSESPFVRAREADQRFYARRFRNVTWKVLELAWCRLGKFDRFGLRSFRDLQRLIDVQVEPPAITTRNKTEETNRNKVLADAGLLSHRTWSQKEDLDPDMEQKNIAEERPVTSITDITTDADRKPGDTTAAATASGADAVQDLALNGITSLLDIVSQVAARQLPIETARATIQAAFPTLQPAEIDRILKPLATFQPSPPADVKPAIESIATAVRDELFKQPFKFYP